MHFTLQILIVWIQRHIDTASVYANEQGVGRGIKKAIDEGIVTRKDLFGE